MGALFPIGAASSGGGDAGDQNPLLLNLQYYTGNASVSNDVADALDASGITGGTVTFPSGAKAGAYKDVKIRFVISDFVYTNDTIVIWGPDGPLAEYGFNVNGFSPEWINSGASQYELTFTTEETQDVGYVASVLASSMSSIFGPTVAEGNVVTITIAGTTIDYPDPIAGPAILESIFQHSGESTATRRASVSSLLSKGWTVNNKI